MLSDRFARLGTIAFVLFGVALRVSRWLMDFPLWGDEVFVCQNFPGRDFRTILDQLENGQICPPLFLWAQLAAYRLLGDSDFAMRLVPLLAGVIALVGFRSMAVRVLSPAQAMVAVGLLAVAPWPMTMATNAKPYSFDLAAAVALQLAALRCLERPTDGRFALLVLAMPLAMIGSYPAAFVGGGVLLALLPVAWRAGIAVKALYALAALLLFAAFGFVTWVGQSQLKGEYAPEMQNFLLDYWKEGFPPEHWWQWPQWLLEAHTGRMMAYPLGDSHFLSIATTFCFVAGTVAWLRGKRWTLLAMLLVPLALNFAAALMLKYPYAACGRLTQHLAPAICLLTAAGLGWLIERGRNPAAGYLRFAGFLAIIGVAWVLYEVAKPYHDREAKWMRDIPREITRTSKGASILVVGEERATPNVLRWYLRRSGARWLGDDRTVNEAGPMWIVNQWVDEGSTPDRTPPPMTWPEGWTVCGEAVYHMRPNDEDDTHFHCRVRVVGPPGTAPVVFNAQP